MKNVFLPVMFAAFFTVSAFGQTPVNRVNTIADMKALGMASSATPDLIVGGYNINGDWGGGIFKWDAGSTAPINPCDAFQADGVLVGRWLRQRNGTDVRVEECGAYHDNTNGAATVAGIQAALDLVKGSGNPEARILLLGPHYASDNNTTLIVDTPYYCPNIVGGGIHSTTYHFKPSSDKAAVLFTDNTKGVCRGGLSGMRFDGNEHTIPVEVRDRNGPRLEYRVSEAKVGALLQSYAYGFYAEHVHLKLYIDNCDDLADQVVVRYRTTAGSGSFKDSGLIEGTNISAMTEYCSILAINAGSQPYQIPLSFSIFNDEGNVVVVNNDSANTISAYGHMNLEVGLNGTLTLASGTSTNYSGTINKLASGKVNYGRFTFSLINGTASPLGLVAANDQVVFGENSDGSNLQYLTVGANQTTVLNTDFAVFRTATYYISIVGQYNWNGIVDVFDNTAGTKSVFVRGHRFIGAADPTFTVPSGRLAVTVPDSIAANSAWISWVKYIPNENGH